MLLTVLCNPIKINEDYHRGDRVFSRLLSARNGIIRLHTQIMNRRNTNHDTYRLDRSGGRLCCGGSAVFLLGIRYRKRVAEKEISSAEEEATRIINEAIKSSESKKREALVEAKEEILKSRSEYEKEVKERRADLQKQERRLQQKEENLDHKMDAIEKKEEALAAKHAAADKVNEEIQIIKRSQTEMLERISGFTADQAKDYLIAQVESEVTHETALKIKEIEPGPRTRPTAAPGKSWPPPSSAAPPTMWPRSPSVWFPCPMTR